MEHQASPLWPRQDWSPKTSGRGWAEIWPPLSIFAVYLLLLHNYWIGAARLPFQDTLFIYETFAIAYNQFFHTGELAQWLPYSSYGLPAHLYGIANFPPLYLMSFASGALLGIRNTWTLFSCAVALDLAIFTFGSYRLIRQFASRGAAAALTAALLWTMALDWNLYFSLRLLSLMPLGLFFVVRFARTGSLVSLSLAVVVAIIGCLGTAYFAPYYAFFYICCTVALWIVHRPKFHISRPLTFSAIVIFALAACAAVIFLYVASINDLHFLADQRDPVTGTISLDTFMNYGGLQIFKTLEPFVGLPTENKTALFYAGSLTLVGAVYALWRHRTGELLALAALLIIFVLFCWGPYSPVTRLAYYFPGMPYFRHVGLMYAVPKLLLSIIAAAGLDAMLAGFPETRRDAVRLSVVLGVVSAALAVAYFPLAAWLSRQIVDAGRPSAIALLGAALGGYALAALIFGKARSPAIVPLLLLVTFAQALAYQHLFHDALNLPIQASVEETHVHPFKFVETRDTGALRNTNLYHDISSHGAIYTELDSFLQIDECVPVGHLEYVTRPTHELMQHVFGNDVSYDALAQKLADGGIKPAVAHVLGCGVSKIQWVPASAATTTSGGGTSKDCIERVLCLEAPGGEQKVVPWVDGKPPAAPSLSSQGIVLDRFSFNEIAVSLTVNSGGWLVYADSAFPGWRAEVDGTSVPIWRANFAFKAVPLESGHHTVRFYFSDPTYNWVLWVTDALAMVAILALFVVAFRTRDVIKTPRTI
jgi:Bacterial membrane protein YfhO